MAPSSAYVSAPKKDNSPPTSHARYTSLAEPTACIISAGTRKIPLPMIVPTTMADAWLTPRSRASSGRTVVRWMIVRWIGSGMVWSLSVYVRDEGGLLYPGCLRSELAAYPTVNVTMVPIITHHVHGTVVHFHK